MLDSENCWVGWSVVRTSDWLAGWLGISVKVFPNRSVHRDPATAAAALQPGQPADLLNLIFDRVDKINPNYIYNIFVLDNHNNYNDGHDCHHDQCHISNSKYDHTSSNNLYHHQ